MIAQNTQYVQHTPSDAIGLVYRVVTSPYYSEEIIGLLRVQVWTLIPGEGGPFFGWDYWLIEDCQALPNETVQIGSTVRFTSRSKKPLEGEVIASSHVDICVFLSDGTIGWIKHTQVVEIIAPNNASLTA